MIKNSKLNALSFENQELFRSTTYGIADDARISEALDDGVVLNLNKPALAKILKGDTEFITLPIPDGKGGTVILELAKVDIFAPGFSIKTSKPTSERLEEAVGVHYRGMVKGDDHSLAAISIFKHEVMGFFSTEAQGNNVIGRLGGNNPTNKHILYAEKDLKASFDFHCDTKDDGVVLPASVLQEPEEEIITRCIKIYMEGNYDLFLNKGSVNNTGSYLTGMFNQSATLFANEGIPVAISEITVWNSPSPYNGAGSLDVLNQFRTIRTSFNGDLAHLITLDRNFGGIAYLSALCNRSFSYAVSDVDPTFSTVPTYSWTVSVFTHETGHNLGSPHTHACAWNGNGTAIDGCGPIAGYPEPGATCNVGPLPPQNGGTIMSYCHLLSGVGINFNLGFGTQPRNVIVNGFNTAACLTDCGGNCTYALTRTSRSFSAASASSFVNVNTQTGCAWSATVNAPALFENILFSQPQGMFSLLKDLTAQDNLESVQVAPETVFLNSTPITINDRTANTNPPGTASLYPSSITVSGMTGTITQVDAALNNLTHTFPDDIDIILVGPGGQRAILMSDAGGGGDVSGVNLTFNQSASTQLPDSTQLASGTYRPTNFNGNTTIEPGGVDNFPSPGPGQSAYTADLSVFNGTNPNGTWQIYVVDDENVDSGSIATGWALGITTSGGGTSWITIISGSTGTGNGTVNYNVATNTGTSQRTGTITVNGQIHTIMQSGTSPCTYSMSTNSNNTGQGTGSTNFFINTPSGCAWSAVSDSPSWLTTSSSGSGNGTINYNYTANNTTSTRIGRITAGGQVHTVTQIGLGGGGSVQFSSTNYSINENAGTATITVTRIGGTASGSVQYSTSNGTALAGVDYQSASGTLFFFENETTKTFTVTILDDLIFEGNETINLSLSSASPSFSLGNPNSTVLTIIDNESNPPNNRKPFDFDGDSKTDIGIFRPSNGQWWINRSSNNQTVAAQFGQSSDKLVPADFTGDGKTDVAFWRPSTGQWFIIRSEDNSFYAFPFGSFGDIPAPGDFDGDGRADPAVFRPSNATWYILLSGGGVAIRQFGVSEDKPVVADYDGDGKDDIAIFRPSVSEWWLLRSTAGLQAVQFGQAGDKTVQGDYTGDGKADIAFWRPSNGFWYILRSEDNSFFAYPFGSNGDIPTPGDYDGDGKADAAVFRPSNATWYLQRSTSGFTAIGFGITGDQPIPNAFVR